MGYWNGIYAPVSSDGWKTCCAWRIVAWNIIELNGGFSSKPCLITAGQSNHFVVLSCTFGNSQAVFRETHHVNSLHVIQFIPYESILIQSNPLHSLHSDQFFWMQQLKRWEPHLLICLRISSHPGLRAGFGSWGAAVNCSDIERSCLGQDCWLHKAHFHQEKTIPLLVLSTMEYILVHQEKYPICWFYLAKKALLKWPSTMLALFTHQPCLHKPPPLCPLSV